MAKPAYGQGNGKIDPDELRRFLIDCASHGRTVTYSEVANAFGEPWHQGIGSSLKKALNLLGTHNRRADEPLLMALVVNKESRQPGVGYYEQIGEGAADPDRKAKLAEDEIRRCFAWSWPG